MQIRNMKVLELTEADIQTIKPGDSAVAAAGKFEMEAELILFNGKVIKNVYGVAVHPFSISESKDTTEIVNNWKTVRLDELIIVCKSCYGAKYLLLQRQEVISLAKAKGIRAGEAADILISSFT